MIFTQSFLDRVRRATIKNRQVFFPIVYSQYDPRWVYSSEDAQAEMDSIHVPFQNLDDQVDSNLPKHLRNPYLISKNSGYWRQFGFGIAALYSSDFRQAGELILLTCCRQVDKNTHKLAKIQLVITFSAFWPIQPIYFPGGFDTSIQGWGKEDVDLYGKFIESNLTIFRAADPGIVHVYHEIICDPNLPPNQLVMCLGTKSSSYASTHQVGAMPVKNYEAKLILCCGKMCTLCAKFKLF